ncbi:hypothetical protein AVEN_112321-1 [Araneus ventricosus]|uniref:Uncharacterized protein n=1 Tax=Araneus ventricosus TaxID=182803 RepID=A0A4Y2SMT0_ARAVE|nr:hypothetical protein AVEN_112321-1 [Araneus ventricosus]
MMRDAGYHGNDALDLHFPQPTPFRFFPFQSSSSTVGEPICGFCKKIKTRAKSSPSHLSTAFERSKSTDGGSRFGSLILGIVFLETGSIASYERRRLSRDVTGSCGMGVASTGRQMTFEMDFVECWVNRKKKRIPCMKLMTGDITQTVS